MTGSFSFSPFVNSPQSASIKESEKLSKSLEETRGSFNLYIQHYQQLD